MNSRSEPEYLILVSPLEFQLNWVIESADRAARLVALKSGTDHVIGWVVYLRQMK